MIDSLPSTEMPVLLEGPGVQHAITPHCVVVTLSSKPTSQVLVTGGLDGYLKIITYKKAADENYEDSVHAVGSPITSLISVDNAPLVIVGTYDGSIQCIHIGQKNATTVLMNIKVSSQAISKLTYQETTQKLAVATINEHGHQEVIILCLDPNNMAVIGRFETSSLIDALTWDRDDFKLLIALGGSISCYNTIGMTFDNAVSAELLWNRQLDEPSQIREMRMNDDGNVLYAIDGKHHGVYTISLLNAGGSEEKLTTVHCGNAECSASYCFIIIDKENIAVGSVSGEVSTCELGDNYKWKSWPSLPCAVTSLCAVGSGGFVSGGMDGTLLENNIKEGNTSTSASSSQWDYLLHDNDAINQKTTNLSHKETDTNMLYREEYICPDKDTRLSTSKVKLLTLDNISEMKTNGHAQDCVCLYSLQSTAAGEVSDVLEEHEIATLVDIHELRMRLGEDNADSHIFVKAVLGEVGLRDVTVNDAFMVVDSEVVATKKNMNAELKEKIAKSMEMTDKLQHEIKLLEWNQEHLKLQTLAALEESKDWQSLRVTNHLRQVVDGKAVSDEKALSNSLDKLAIAEGFQKTQMQMFERGTERISNQIKTTETENELLKRQIQDAKEKIAKREMEYNSIAEVKTKASSQQNKMSQLLRRRRLADEVQSQDKTIAELRSQLKALRARTFPHFD
ncbi:hypothetical protein ACHAWO_003417 [Cyclotella atomus]|uniref:Cilia- and flagella-associated protein 43 n=1 Tax=Cyclotella atomus TaxID=382360 RepID=A0ABD3QDQ8_9STRA